MGRENNGGHITIKKRGGIDKRKRAFRNEIYAIVKVEDIATVMKALLKESKKGDVNAIRLFLEYTVGKPVQQTDITSGGKAIQIPIINFTVNQANDDTPRTIDID